MANVIRAVIIVILSATMSAQAAEVAENSFYPPEDSFISQKPVGITPRQKAFATDTPRQKASPGTATDTLTSVPMHPDAAYRIGPRDTLEISVFNVPELSKPVEVSDIGTINLPLLGEVPAAGKTVRELERHLTSVLGESYLQNPQVSVIVKGYNSQAVIVTGGIKNPGVYKLTGNTTLLEVVVMAGGFTSESDSTVIVLREQAGKRTGARFDVAAIEKGRAEDPILQQGDRVVAGTSVIKKGYAAIMKIIPLARFGMIGF